MTPLPPDEMFHSRFVTDFTCSLVSRTKARVFPYHFKVIFQITRIPPELGFYHSQVYLFPSCSYFK